MSIMNSLFVENVQVVAGIVPVDLTTAATNGDWVTLSKYNGCAIVVFKGVGTAGQDPTITVRQATDVAGTGAKALDFTRIDSKEATALTAVGTFTTTTQAAANTYTNATLAEKQAIIVIDIKADQMDVANGFNCLQVQIDDPGATAGQFGCALYLLYGPTYQLSPLPSAIA